MKYRRRLPSDTRCREHLDGCRPLRFTRCVRISGHVGRCVYGVRARSTTGRHWRPMRVHWQDIPSYRAGRLDLSKRLDVTAPRNEIGQRCPWPWEPQQLKGAPMGQYHCPYCGGMVLAGRAHLDYGTEGVGG